MNKSIGIYCLLGLMILPKYALASAAICLNNSAPYATNTSPLNYGGHFMNKNYNVYVIASCSSTKDVSTSNSAPAGQVGAVLGHYPDDGGGPVLGTNYSLFTSSSGNNKYCWCKIVSPFLGQWVLSSISYTSSDNCLYNCVQMCQTVAGTGEYPDLHTKLYQGAQAI